MSNRRHFSPSEHFNKHEQDDKEMYVTHELQNLDHAHNRQSQTASFQATRISYRTHGNFSDTHESRGYRSTRQSQGRGGRPRPFHDHRYYNDRFSYNYDNNRSRYQNTNGNRYHNYNGDNNNKNYNNNTNHTNKNKNKNKNKQNKKYLSKKRHKWQKKKEKILAVNNVLSEKVVYRLNYLQSIFTFLNFFDLIGVSALLSKYHYNIIFCNDDKNVLDNMKKNNNIGSESNNKYVNRIFELCFENTFKNLIKHVIKPLIDEKKDNNDNNNNNNNNKKNELPRLTLLPGYKIRPQQQACAPTGGAVNKFKYDKIHVYPLFNDFFSLSKMVIESNVMLLQYGRGNLCGKPLSGDDHDDLISGARVMPRYTPRLDFEMADMYANSCNVCFLLAIDDAQFVQFWLNKVKKKYTTKKTKFVIFFILYTYCLISIFDVYCAILIVCVEFA